MVANAAHIPNYLSARSPSGLRRLCFLNNFKKGSVFNYQIVFASGKWFAWYIDTEKSLVEEVLTEVEASDSTK